MVKGLNPNKPPTLSLNERVSAITTIVSELQDNPTDNPPGAGWDDVIDAMRERHGVDEEKTEEAINFAMDRQVIYEPVLSWLKVR